jgi:hypothetical protein
MWEGREQGEFSDSADGKIQNENQSLRSNGNDSDVPRVSYGRGDRMSTDHDVNL